MYIILCGYPPFWGKTDKDLFNKIKSGKFEFHKEGWAHVSPDAKDLISKMLIVDPVQRIPATEAYAHPWIQQNVQVEPLNQEIMGKLQIFNAKNKIRTAFMQLIVSQIQSLEDNQNITNYFKTFDKNGDGLITKEELCQAYDAILHDPWKAKRKVESIFDELDQDRSGKIDYTEFLVAASNKEKTYTNEKIEKAFNLVDEDHNGQITKQEVEDMLGGLPIKDSVWQQVLNECDKNNDGMISRDEFFKLLLKVVDYDSVVIEHEEQ